MLVAPYATPSETVSEAFFDLKSTANKEAELALGNSAWDEATAEIWFLKCVKFFQQPPLIKNKALNNCLF